MQRASVRPRLVVVSLLAAASVAVSSASAAAAPIERWLLLGPVAHPMPAFSTEKPGAFGSAEALAGLPAPGRLGTPQEGAEVGWPGAGPARWRVVRADGSRGVRLEGGGPSAVAFLAAWLRVDRHTAMKLEVVGTHARRAWLDGAEVDLGGTGTGDDADAPLDAEVKLPRGTHVLVVASVRDPGHDDPWRLGARLLRAGKDGPEPAVEVATTPQRPLDILDVLEAPRVGSLAIDPEGRLVAAGYERVVPGTSTEESWVELRTTSDGARVHAWPAGAGARQPAFSPDGRWISYVVEEDPPPDAEKDAKPTSALWLVDRRSWQPRALVRGVSAFGGYLWSPEGGSIVFWSGIEPDEDTSGLKRVESLLDRRAGHRTRTHLSLVDVGSGVTRRLTAGPIAASVTSISPDGGRLLFVREVEDLGARPYARHELWEMDLRTGAVARLRDGRWLDSAQYAPDGRRLLVKASPSEFGPAGVALEPGALPNEYEGDLFLLDPASGAVRALTRDFDPSVESAHWSRADGRIYLRAMVGDAVRLYRLDPEAGSFSPLEAGVDVVEALAVAERAARAVAMGTSPWVPQQIEALDLRDGTRVLLDRPAAERLEHVRRGTTKPWSFTSSAGRQIEGRVYLPPDFDESRRYPAIVYFYGGTHPTSREWGGRYPKEWWASHGYVVYVLQPSGATGYGQAFSAAHVNDWGEVVVGEILEGTRAFLDAHPFVDGTRLGCIGASFGGFVTELLVTRSTLFRAAVSHAGISSIATYWGQGTWGYSYSAAATANSFPWNRRDIYVDRSPLFHADKVKTPILLTHGAADTNVPVGESDAFFTALKIAGAPVEYVQVAGEDHWIVAHDKRLAWSRTILAWFDRWLRDDPGWWEALHPSR